jgi:hypothetical protein
LREADSRLHALVWGFLGEPPAKGAPRAQLLRWLRGIHLRTLPLALVAYAMLLVWADEAWILLTAGIGLLISLESVISLSVRIRREERRERG